MDNCQDTVFVHTPLGAYSPNQKPIRLLHIQSSFHNSAEIKCTLKHADLLENPQFKALSYVWGNPDVTLPIFIDGKPYRVTLNCHSAMLRLREVGELCIWIDAVCINQTDSTEKVAQIGLMNDIYYVATQVVVWLGAGPGTVIRDEKTFEDLAFALLEDIATLDRVDDPETFMAVASRDDPKKRWGALATFGSLHEWCRRLWTFQEYVLSKAAVFLTRYRFHHPVLGVLYAGSIITRLQSEHNSICHSVADFYKDAGRKAAEDMAIWCPNAHSRYFYNLAYDRNAKKLNKQNLFALLKETGGQRCSDARDRLFAITALLDKETTDGFQFDYEEDVCSFFAKMAFIMIIEDRSLEIVSSAWQQKGDTNDIPEMPSWVRRWHTKEFGPYYLHYHLYKAALNTTPYLHLDIKTLELQVLGVCIDKVLLNISLNGLTADFHFPDGYRIWREHFSKYPTGCNPEEAWLRTVTADLRVPFPARRFSSGDVILADILRYAAETVSDGANRIYESFQALLDVSLSQSYALDSRVAFITRTGYIGIGPKSLEQGDMVCILAGCNVPVVIRKSGDHHILVGDCFVWGLMDGEALYGMHDSILKGKKVEKLVEEDCWEHFKLR